MSKEMRKPHRNPMETAGSKPLGLRTCVVCPKPNDVVVFWAPTASVTSKQEWNMEHGDFPRDNPQLQLHLSMIINVWFSVVRCVCKTTSITKSGSLFSSQLGQLLSGATDLFVLEPYGFHSKISGCCGSASIPHSVLPEQFLWYKTNCSGVWSFKTTIRRFPQMGVPPKSQSVDQFSRIKTHGFGAGKSLATWGRPTSLRRMSVSKALRL